MHMSKYSIVSGILQVSHKFESTVERSSGLGILKVSHKFESTIDRSQS